jgi:hypothetical protein
VHTDTVDEESRTAPVSADEMLTRVRRELVGIHAAVDARTYDDKEIVPWTKRELLALVREIRSFQEAHASAGKRTAG